MTTKISYANMLAELCEHLPGGDIDVVTDAIGVDRRIGHAYARPSVRRSVLPARQRALAAAAAQVGARDIAAATDAINRRQLDRLVGVVRTHASPRQHRIGVLGLAYKPGTPVVEESQGVMLANRLAADGFATSVFDPAALPDAAAALAPSVSCARALVGYRNLRRAGAHGAVAGVPRDTSATARGGTETVVIVDCWRQLAPLRSSKDSPISCISEKRRHRARQSHS